MRACHWSQKENSAVLLADHPKSRRGDGRRVDSDRACWLKLMMLALTPRAGVCQATAAAAGKRSPSATRSLEAWGTWGTWGTVTSRRFSKAREQRSVLEQSATTLNPVFYRIHFYWFLRFIVKKKPFFIFYSRRGPVQDIPTTSSVSSNL